MSSQLLFECLSEEIPSRMQNSAAAQVKSYAVNAFNKNNVKFASVEVFITARRIALFVDNISVSDLKDSNNEIKGPNVNALKSAVEGFLRKHQKNEKDLLIRKVNNVDFYFIKKDACSFNIQEFLKNQLEEMLKNFSWLKSLRWSEGKERWVRPIKNILCILNDEIIPMSFAGITACNATYGHRFLSSSAMFTVKTPKNYFELLEKNNVILQPDKRKQFILDQINKFAKEQNLQLEKNDYLLNELTGLIEWPIVLFGKVNQEKSSGLPKEVILSIINTQQKYLALSNGKRISHFVTVVNVNNDEVIKGHERILEARLADAQFLISQDKKENLDHYVKKLDSILFHASLGSVGEKVKRITALSKYIAIFIPHASLVKVERAAYLAKADLTTSIVKEFPELQGVMGGYYASYFQEDEEIVEAITEHYKPIGSERECPKSPIAVAVAIADKVDSLVGLIAAREKISGSYDQFGLRRMAIGIIRTILENNLHIPIRLLIDKSVSLHLESALAGNVAPVDQFNKLREKILEVVLKFFLERFKIIIKNRGIKQDIVDSILYRTDISDLLTAERQTVILDRYLSTPEGEQILSTYKRVSNIVNKAEKSSNTAYSTSYSKKCLIESEEIALSDYAIIAYKNIKQAIKNNHFNAALDELNGFVPFIDKFMDSVKINCDSDRLRRNRLFLLASVVSIFHLVADFSLI
ncbi:glycine--tRNA ligase subunit beta [Wolbachia endosymbiont of Atemnus politus]|uniref:glycine--tRNA ligase subunit beta n=1 Tax=Wolbachia endosymbiont of Atemnus politus TaxID=2682840 RepID=UPI0015726757|nr:glycine--tRNA ligase subunit beta [Wolbachia endosymbiont of Atemnus politus]NSM56248.1 glycine--tRNA ligase subunit beta [Wolbachia endosymbiont of Atemnus politus]NSX83021.1 glycine--tRNA ligase subunit beta [Wolbachia endosymbiont of Atemnus politus]